MFVCLLVVFLFTYYLRLLETKPSLLHGQLSQKKKKGLAVSTSLKKLNELISSLGN